ncbi:MAG: UDP-N-acetylmuramoyl-L-alanine--D-glutamate ligase [Bryobacteraceae bacterium]|nr:UDP-N-acetylmuramoyl-L-alanine--D-glutamate ligase [Bryobacteraceae bacterium]
MTYPVEGKTVLVVGMGKSGLAAIDLLLAKGATVRATDSRPVEVCIVPLFPQTVETFTSVDLVVLSPGVPADIPEVLAARSKGIPVIGEVELAGYYLRGPVIGITGSNGKTTTTAMVGHILGEAGVARQVGGNIGTPPTAMVETSRENQWNVLELSSFQTETIEEFRVDIGVGLNLTPDHLDRHGTLQKYNDAKARLFDLQQPRSFAVLNADDPATCSWAGRTKAEVHWFSRRSVAKPGAWLKNDVVIIDGLPLLTTQEIPLMGVHNVENTMAAAAAARLIGAAPDAIAAGIRSFPGVEHRIEFVREAGGVRYYNDSKATNVDAAEKAIDAFPGNLWIILGGKDKNSDYSVLRNKLAVKSKGILLIGAAADKIASQLAGLPLIRAGALDSAVELAANRATSGDTVLLAPACASFDQFQSYEHRGRVFKELVRKL